jgi:membrane protein DedA with SNARE-associated domain
VQRALDKYGTYVVLSFRFFYGLRNITPFVIGSTGFSPTRFFLLNATGAAIWAVVVGSGGYLFGEAIKLFLADVKKYERLLLLAVALGGCVLWFIHSRVWRKRTAVEPTPTGLDQPVATGEAERKAVG